VAPPAADTQAQPAAEAAVSEPVAAAPVAEPTAAQAIEPTAPPVETPIAEQPVASTGEAPTAESPAAEPPAQPPAEAPVAEQPAVPVADTPVAESSAEQQPVAEQPVTPSVETPVVEPVVSEPVSAVTSEVAPVAAIADEPPVASVATEPVAEPVAVVEPSPPTIASDVPQPLVEEPVSAPAPVSEAAVAAEPSPEPPAEPEPEPVVADTPAPQPTDLRDATPTFVVEPLPITEPPPAAISEPEPEAPATEPVIAATPEPEPELDPEPASSDTAVIGPRPQAVERATPEPETSDTAVIGPRPLAAASAAPEPETSDTALIGPPRQLAPVIAAAIPPPAPPPDPDPEPPPPPASAPPTLTITLTQPTPTETETDPAPMSRSRHITTIALVALNVLAFVVFVAWLQRPGAVLALTGGPADGATLARDEAVAWTLNLPLEADSLARAPLPSVTPATAGTCAWRDASTVVFTPSGALPAGAEVTIGFPPDLKAAGRFAFPDDAVPHRTLHTLPAITVASQAAVAAGFDDPVISLALNRAPGDPAALIAGVTVSPHVAFRSEVANGVLRLVGAIVPGQTYRVAIADTAPGHADDRPAPWSADIAVPARSPAARLAAGTSRSATIEAVGLTEVIVECDGGRFRTMLPLRASADGSPAKAEVPAWMLRSGRQTLVLRWEGGSREVSLDRVNLPLQPEDAAPALLGRSLPVTAVR
jgi:hypothetical protein